MESAINISKDAFDYNQVNVNGNGHELTHLINSKAQIRTSEGEIMERANHSFVLLRIGKNRTLIGNQPEVRSTRDRAGLEVCMLCLRNRS